MPVPHRVVNLGYGHGPVTLGTDTGKGTVVPITTSSGQLIGRDNERVPEYLTNINQTCKPAATLLLEFSGVWLMPAALADKIPCSCILTDAQDAAGLCIHWVSQCMWPG